MHDSNGGAQSQDVGHEACVEVQLGAPLTNAAQEEEEEKINLQMYTNTLCRLFN